jgi:hypothetical protein
MRPTRYQRATVSLKDATRSLVAYSCIECENVWTKRLMIGPRGMRRPISPDAAAMMVKVWQGYGRTTGRATRKARRQHMTTNAAAIADFVQARDTYYRNPTPENYKALDLAIRAWEKATGRA